MKKHISIMIFLFIFLIIGANIWAGGNKEKSDDWTGIYMGVIPAADCPGIAVVAIFNTDGNYKITYQYIDRSVDVVTFTGSYTLDGKTKMITLDGGNLPSYYMLKKHSLIQLDMAGQEIKGKLADNYKLRKVKFPQP